MVRDLLRVLNNSGEDYEDAQTRLIVGKVHILDEIAAQYEGKIKITKLDVDANARTPGMFNVTGIPTLLVFRGGKLVETLVGFMPKDKLLAKLLPHLN